MNFIEVEYSRPRTTCTDDDWFDTVHDHEPIHVEYGVESLHGDNINAVFDKAASHLKITPQLLNNIAMYAGAFVNANDEHVKFFGGNLLGVHTVRFKTSDKLEWNEDILGIDENATRKALVALPSIDANWARATDVMNMSCLWLVHRIYSSTLTATQKQRGMIDTLMVMHYKFFSSLMAHYFRYPADEATALATYAALSKKYAIKQHGNWQAVFHARCIDIVAITSPHYLTIQRFNDDTAVLYMLTDIQGRLRNMVKNIWMEFDKVRQQNTRISTVGGTVELDGKTIVRDLTRMYTPYRTYLHEVILDKGRFIKTDLVEVITAAMPTMSEPMFRTTLMWMVKEKVSRNKLIDDIIDNTLLHTFEYLRTDRSAAARMDDLTALLAKLKALYMSSRTSDPVLLKLRENIEGIVKLSTHATNPSLLAATRTGVMLYLILRTFTKKYYA